MSAVRVMIQRMDYAPKDLPRYITVGSAGADLQAAWPNDGTLPDTIILGPGARVKIHSGFKAAVPEGHELQCRSRSGLALNNGIHVLNSPGTIDSDYRGEICAILHNASEKPFRIKRGDRVAQLVLTPVVQAEFTAVDELPPTERGEGGFGSSGI